MATRRERPISAWVIFDSYWLSQGESQDIIRFYPLCTYPHFSFLWPAQAADTQSGYWTFLERIGGSSFTSTHCIHTPLLPMRQGTNTRSVCERPDSCLPRLRPSFQPPIFLTSIDRTLSLLKSVGLVKKRGEIWWEMGRALRSLFPLLG